VECASPDLVSALSSKRRPNRPIGNPTALEVILVKLKEGLPNESASYVVDGCCQLSTSHLFLDLVEGCLDGLTIGAVSANANGFSACIVDLFDNRVVVRWFAG
jgi:hypothetical protein